jgi:hypothetical protein
MRATTYRAAFILTAKETDPILIYLLGYKVISMYTGLRARERERERMENTIRIDIPIPTKGKHILINFC